MKVVFSILFLAFALSVAAQSGGTKSVQDSTVVQPRVEVVPVGPILQRDLQDLLQRQAAIDVEIQKLMRVVQEQSGKINFPARPSLVSTEDGKIDLSRIIFQEIKPTPKDEKE